MSKFSIELIGTLDTKKTEQNLKGDLKNTIAKHLNEQETLKAVGHLDLTETKKKIQKQLDNISKNLKITLNVDVGKDNNIHKASKETINAEKKSIQESNNLLNEQIANRKRILEIQKQLALKNADLNSEEAVTLSETLAKRQKDKNILDEKAKSYANIISLEERENLIIEKTKKQQEDLTQAIAKSKDETVNTLGKDLSSLDKFINQKIFTDNSNNFNVQKVKTEIQSISVAYSNLLNDINKNGFTDNTAARFTELSQRISKVATNAERLKTELNEVSDATRLVSEKKNLSNNIKTWLDENTNASKSLRTQMEKLLEDIQNADREKFIGLNEEFQNLNNYAKATDQTGRSLFAELKNNLSKFTNWFDVSNIVMGITNQASEALDTLKEVDTILTELSKTSDRSEASLKKLGETAFKSANEYGATVQGYLSGVQEMSRAGFNEKQSEELAKLSILAQSAGDLEATVANDYLIVTNAAYQLKGSTEALNKVLDGQTEITNRNAVALEDMAEATSEAASMAAKYGVDIDELSAMIAVATAKTRESGSETGNALKNIFINLQDTGNNEIVKTFNEIGVSMTEIVNGSEKLKDPITLLKELSDVFTSLDESDSKRSNILSEIGGKYYAGTLAAILSDWSSYEKILNDYSEGQGSARKQAEKTASSWEGSLNRLNNSWTAFIQNFTNSDSITTFIGLVEKAINLLDGLTEHFGLAGTAFTALMTYKSAKNEGGDKTISPMNMPFLNYNNELCA